LHNQQKTAYGERGTGERMDTYPDLPWEPKQAFGAVASFYAAH
jgi:hypothetical protein